MSGFRAFLNWHIERLRRGAPARPSNGELPVVESRIAHPRARPGEIRITWIGHSTFLIQHGPLNLLTDPVWGDRASPVTWAGPRRIVPPGVSLEDLPPLDAVLVSHDHFDHLDRPTVQWLARTHPDLWWYAPLGHAEWLRARGVRNTHDLDWWDTADLGDVRITAVPAQHWTQRRQGGRNERLWCAWSIRGAGAATFFGGDSGWFEGYGAIGARTGPHDVSILPIGAYSPRWFMRPFHMSPEEAIDAWSALGGRGAFVPMHWGTFLLSDEPVLEPPQRLRTAWRERGLPGDDLRIPAHGGTVVIGAGEP